MRHTDYFHEGYCGTCLWGRTEHRPYSGGAQHHVGFVQGLIAGFMRRTGPEASDPGPGAGQAGMGPLWKNRLSASPVPETVTALENPYAGRITVRPAHRSRHVDISTSHTWTMPTSPALRLRTPLIQRP
jgi:hypothetical protein